MKKNCKNCNKEFNASKSSKQHCSNECFQQYRKRPEIIKETIKKRIESNLKKYGVDNAAKSNEIKEKTKQTCLKKYGVISPTLVKEIHQKQINTNLEKYGVKNPQQNKEIQKKQQETLFKNYGVTVPLKNNEIKEKIKQTCLEKYGVNNIAKLEEIKEKIKQTCLEKYGVNNPLLYGPIKDKMINGILKKHYNKILKNIKYSNIIFLFSENQYFGNISYKTKYPFQCKICNTFFEDTLISGHIPRCPNCYPPKLFYKENLLFDYLVSILPLEIIEKHNRNILDNKELDIYIPSLKLAIEFNGLYWHSDIRGKKYKNYHLNKTKKCNEKGIRLIHIFEDEWINNEEIVKSKLKYILNINNTNKIYARKCVIKEIDSNSSKIFLEKYHIQGADNSSIRIGLFYNNELISIMTFGKFRLALGYKLSKENEYELIRFCTGEKNVIGAGGKLFSYFIKHYNPLKIISYADKRWSNSNAFYSKIGFKLFGETKPNYWYIDKNYMHRIHRFNFRKQVLTKMLPIFDPSLTEWENMQINGYDRIWDCGNLKYEWINTPNT